MGEACKDGVNQLPVSESLLDLGLSLGGCYSQIPSAIPLTIRNPPLRGNPTRNDAVLTDFFAVSPPKKPTAAELEVRRVKAIQARKRFEAKKRLVEKQRRGGFGGGGCKEEKSPAAAESESAGWAIDSASRNNAFCRAMGKLQSNVGPSHSLRTQGAETSIPTKFPTISQPAFISMAKDNGKSLLANYRSDGKSPIPGSSLSTSAAMANKMANGKRLASSDSRPETEQYRKLKKGRVLPDGALMLNELFTQMPSVITTGNGPEGRKIEGFLFRYLETTVRIVCVCHGSFLSPEDFVKHAGGGEVRNPMKHITVLASPF
ncbi:ninja-family protein 1-like [Rhododendron vialii]|uniref:ninja-family protein 1-like n=1 Tax=Rhododendron vialii TaxID=182163 RepID=UPI00265DA8F8|nr:ninja-family protein 1-like [Rhododendron vialii]XP_058180750.1 ninja-family protein 1-like [Rhododendron vialii]